MTLTDDFVIGPIKIGCVLAQDEETQTGTADKLIPLNAPFNLFDIGSAERSVIDDSAFREPLTETLITITRLAMNNSIPSGGVSLPPHITNESYVAEHDIAVAMYYAVYDINGDLAVDLLNSYRTINRVAGDIASAIEAPLSTVDLSTDNAVIQPNATSTGFTDNNGHHKIIERRTDIDMIVAWMRFLLSLDALPYYILISSALIVFFALSIARARRS